MNSKLADNIKKIRKDNNLSQEELADKLGVSRQSVSKWESGGAYPEMDKVLQMCNMFNLNVDELLNQDIREVNEIKESKNKVNRFMDDFLNFITKTINLFTSLKFKEKLKLIIEEIIIVLVLILVGNIVDDLLFKLIGEYLIRVKELTVVYEIIQKIVMCAYGILSLVILIHVFKTRYLDYFEMVDTQEDTLAEDSKEEPKKYIGVKKEKIIIRDPKHSEYKFIKGLLKVMLFFVKCFAFCFLVSVAFMVVGLVAAFVLIMMYIFVNKIFIGIALCILSCTLVTSIFFEGIFDFIFNRKFHAKRIFITLISALIILGIGIALTFNSATKLKFVDKNYELTDTFEEQILYNENMKINGPSNIYNYIIDESLGDNIKVVLKYNKEVQIASSNMHGNSYNAFVFDIDFIFFKLYKESIKGLKENILYSYNQPMPEIEIYGSSANVKKLITKTSKSTISKLTQTENGYILNVDTEFYYDNEAACYLDDFFYSCVDVDGENINIQDFYYNGEVLEYDHDKYTCKHQTNSKYYYCYKEQ